MKKALSILLALLLVFSLSVPAFAEQTEEAPKGPLPTITKHPSGETVREGGSADFIARAENYTEIRWRIVSPDASDTVQAADAPERFGCQVYGLGSTQLSIVNITAEMDGWYAEAMFVNENGYVCTDGAKITVMTGAIEPPVISAQPEGLTLQSGETGTLTVSADVEGNARLVYQWYYNTENSVEGGTPIGEANGKSYTPEEVEGTTYYYVGIYSEKGNVEYKNDPNYYVSSEEVFSDVVAVTYEPAPIEELQPVEEEPAPAEPSVVSPDDPEVQPEESGVVVVEGDETTEPTEADQSAEAGAESEEAPAGEDARPADDRTANSMKWLIYAGGALAAAAIIGGVTALIVRRRGSDEYEDDYDEDEE